LRHARSVSHTSRCITNRSAAHRQFITATSPAPAICRRYRGERSSTDNAAEDSQETHRHSEGQTSLPSPRHPGFRLAGTDVTDAASSPGVASACWRPATLPARHRPDGLINRKAGNAPGE
jgi:hypothetical protein